MHLPRLLVAGFLAAFACGWCPAWAKDDEGITWLVHYDGKAMPGAEWTVTGRPNATVQEGGLRILDDSKEAVGHYRATWKAGTDDEIIVEAKVRQNVMAPDPGEKRKPEPSWFTWRDGSPVSLVVSDGRHQDGLVLFPKLAMSFTDRFMAMTTTDDFHTYRLVIRGTDMSMWVDGVRKVVGQNAFWRPATSPEPFIQFGSNAKAATGDALWASVKLGVRKPSTPITPNPIKVTLGEPWSIPREEVKQTRPYLYDMGQGLLLMSVAQGPDALYGPYALLKSTDTGKTWVPIPGLDQVNTTPLPMIRRADGTIFGASRWTWLQEDGSLLGKTVHLNARATEFTMFDSRIILPKELMPVKKASDVVIFERHIFHEDDGSITAVAWSRRMLPQPDGSNLTVRSSHLLNTKDHGRTWNYVSTLGPGGEPAVVRLSPTEMTAVIRGVNSTQMTQVFSHDGGRTWDAPIPLEEGRVAPDLLLMSNGVLACSYGRPASCIMFSIDGGRTWCSHHIISEKVHFNYCSIREISPGRILFVHDAPKMNAMHIDVERRK
jgi:hypothetical protein